MLSYKSPKLVLQYPASAREHCYKLSLGGRNRTVPLSQLYFSCKEGKLELTFNTEASSGLSLSFILK